MKFRADRALFLVAGGPTAGLGHLRRCTALARALMTQGAESRFLVDGPASSLELPAALGIPAEKWSETAASMAAGRARDAQAKVVIVDSYAWGTGELTALRGLHDGRLVVLDDLGDRWLTADVVVNGAAFSERLGYATMPIGKRLLGPKYVMLQPEFASARRADVCETVKRIVVLGGGGSTSGEAAGVFGRVAARVFPDARIDGVIGPFADTPTSDGPVCWHRNPPDLLAWMNAADLAVSTAGQTMYELAALGVPAVAVAIADNQIPGAEGLANLGAVRYAGLHSDDDWAERLSTQLVGLVSSRARREQSAAARAVVDGLGATRVADAVME